MAIEAGWDPAAGAVLPWDLTESDLEFLGWHAPLCPELLEHLFPGSPEWLGDDSPRWAVPGVSCDADGSPDGLSPESRGLLAEVAAAVAAQRRAGAWLYRVITALRGSDVLAETGYRALGRLLEDHVRLDPALVTTLDRHADALHPTRTPTGATTPPVLPATATAVDDAVIDDRHVEVIRRTMTRLRAVPGLDDAVLATAEEQLAGLAATRSPRQLASAATVIADRLDPDGAAPVDDPPAGNELHYTRRRNGQLNAKLVLRDPAAAAVFDDAVRAATPPPASAAVADPDTGLPPVTDDKTEVGADPRVEARDSTPARQAHGLLDLIAASHRTGLDHTDHEQHPDSPTASMPLPDLDDTFDTTARPPEPPTDEPADDEPADHRVMDDGDATTAPASDEAADDPAEAREDPGRVDPGREQEPADHRDDCATEATEATEATDSGEPSAGPPPAPPPPEQPPPHRPWTPPDPATMAHPGRERVTLTVTLDYQTLRQQLTDTSHALALLGDSTWIRSETARRLACDADIIPMVLGSKGEVLDVGRKTRSIPTGTYRAVVHRDRHCAFPGCRRRARTSEIHHIIHWADLGETEPDNLVCLCRYHHDLVHHSGWDVIMVDHLPWFTPPHWLDPTRTPRHNRPWQTI